MANKTDLVNAVAEKKGFSKRDTVKAVTAVFDAIQKTVADGQKVSLVGFGTFKPVERKAHTGRNPQTGEAVNVPEHTVPVFKAGMVFKKAVNNQ